MPCRFPLCPGPTSFSNCSLQRSPLFLDNVHRRGVLPTVLQVKLVSWQSTEPAFPPGQDLCSLALELRVRTDLSQSNTPLSDWALQEGQWQPWASHPTPPAWELCPLRSCRCISELPAGCTWSTASGRVVGTESGRDTQSSWLCPTVTHGAQLSLLR